MDGDRARAVLNALCELFGVPLDDPQRDEALLAEVAIAKGEREALALVAAVLGVGAPGERPIPDRVVAVARGTISMLREAERSRALLEHEASEKVKLAEIDRLIHLGLIAFERPPGNERARRMRAFEEALLVVVKGDRIVDEDVLALLAEARNARDDIERRLEQLRHSYVDQGSNL